MSDFREALLQIMERKKHWAWKDFTSGKVPKDRLHYHFEQEYETYVRDFRTKWMRGEVPADEPLVGSGDIQSLADLGNSFSVAEDMRITPVKPAAIVYFVGAFLAPMLPLLLTVMPAEKIIDEMISLVF